MEDAKQCESIVQSTQTTQAITKIMMMRPSNMTMPSKTIANIKQFEDQMIQDENNRNVNNQKSNDRKTNKTCVLPMKQILIVMLTPQAFEHHILLELMLRSRHSLRCPCACDFEKNVKITH